MVALTMNNFSTKLRGRQINNVISIKPNIIIPNKENVDHAKLIKEAHEYIDEVDWGSLFIFGKDKAGFINRWMANSSYEETMYLMERAKYHMMQEIDEANE